MNETTTFPILPNIKAAELTGTVARIAQFIRSSSPDERTLRKTLRQWKVWDKEKTPAFLKMLGAKDTGSHFEPGAFLSRYLDTPDELEKRSLLFQFLRDKNPILVKSIFDALDTEREGRIQSTNELYRMVTSYVYPGELIPLPDFKNWILWMHGIDVLRTIGLRWGFGSIGGAFLEETRELEMEEILEDLEDGASSSWNTSPEPSGSSNSEDEAPQTPEVEQRAEVPSAESRVPEENQAKGTPGSAPAEIPLGIRPLIFSGGDPMMLSLHDEDPDAPISGPGIYTFGQGYRAQDFGIDIEGKDEGTSTLSELCIAALFATRREGSVASSAAHKALRESGNLAGWISGDTSLEDTLKNTGLLKALGGDARFLDLIPVIMHICVTLRSNPRHIADWTTETPESVLRSLHREIFLGIYPLAPYWVLREASLARLIDDPAYETISLKISLTE